MVSPGEIYPHRQRYVDLQKDCICSAEEARARGAGKLVTLRSPCGLKQVEAACVLRVWACAVRYRILFTGQNFKKEKKKERRRRS
jgi:hypothetical protein